jgi:hypothetical protein
LNHLLTYRNFGEIHQVAKMIGSESLEQDVMQSWISKSDYFNDNDDQIKKVIRVAMRLLRNLAKDDCCEAGMGRVRVS